MQLIALLWFALAAQFWIFSKVHLLPALCLGETSLPPFPRPFPLSIHPKFNKWMSLSRTHFLSWCFLLILYRLFTKCFQSTKSWCVTVVPNGFITLECLMTSTQSCGKYTQSLFSFFFQYGQNLDCFLNICGLTQDICGQFFHLLYFGAFHYKNQLLLHFCSGCSIQQNTSQVTLKGRKYW